MALGSVALAAVLRWELNELFATGFVFITFYPAVALTGIIAGGRAGLLATVLSWLAADFFFIEPRWGLLSNTFSGWVALAIFLTGGGLISAMAGLLGRARKREWEAAERARAEAKLRLSEERYRDLVEQVVDGIFVADREGRYLDVNPAGCAMLGMMREEVLKSTFTDVLAPEEHPRLARTIASFADGEVHRSEWRFRRKDGSVFVGELAGRELPDGRLQGVLRDVSARKRMEEAVRESERLYRAIGESINYGIWVCDLEGRNTYASESFLKLVGITQEECSEFRWGNVLHPDDAEAAMAAWKQCVKTGGPWYREHRYRGADGQWHPILACGVPVRDERGEIVQWAGINLDISRLKRTEEELRKAKNELAETNANLERLVTERTAKLQDLVGELEHFSYTLTHDMRAPLRAMRGFTEIVSLVCEDCERKEPKEFLRRVMTSAERMDRLVTDALDYSRSVRQELRLENVDTGILLRGMLDSYPEFQASKARIRLEGDLPVVLGNEAGLTQCFSNLLGNAVKFVKPGEVPEIRIWAEMRGNSETPASGDAERWVRIWVEDQGIGIAKEMLPRVFDMFSRGSNSYEGTGIGLALVRKVTQRMGGRVGVESEEGKGSRFWLELRTAEGR